jgi:hypothetical protein
LQQGRWVFLKNFYVNPLGEGLAATNHTLPQGLTIDRSEIAFKARTRGLSCRKIGNNVRT